MDKPSVPGSWMKPHPTHPMGEWFSDVRCPGSTERFYDVRACTACGEEELRGNAHILGEGNALTRPCSGTAEGCELLRQERVAHALKRATDAEIQAELTRRATCQQRETEPVIQGNTV